VTLTYSTSDDAEADRGAATPAAHGAGCLGQGTAVHYRTYAGQSRKCYTALVRDVAGGGLQ
jgi:hypothetical protein